MTGPQDRRVDVAGHTMRFLDAGSGTPTVVLNAGLGGWSCYWSLVQPRVAEFTRVVAFDRPGLGGSNPGPAPRDAEQVAAEIGAFLDAAQIPPPYVLVGHSQGGFHVRLFAHRHAEQVAGVVFVDSTHEDMASADPTQASALARALTPLQTGLNAAIRLLIRTPFARPVINRRYATLPEHARRELIAGLARRSHSQKLQRETACRERNKQLLRQARTNEHFPDVPLVAISAAGPQIRRLTEMSARVLKRPADELWDEALSYGRDLASLSTRGRHVLAESSGHDIPCHEPELVIAAIRNVVDEARDQ